VDEAGRTPLSRAGELDQGRAAEVAHVLHACLAAPSWVDALVATRPHGDAAGWLAAAEVAYAALPDDAIVAALAAHPRIGAAPAGAGAGAAASRREQAQVSVADDEVRAAIAAGNRAYEERFGRIFLIRAAGRNPREILCELHRRLGNTGEAEFAEAREQLGQIALLRLKRVVAGES
jgi:2-oxo-4-hydroxy-4-carboxy-5-ureidoimidazoline decarboxylase